MLTPLTLSLQRLGGSFDQLFQLWFHRKSAFEVLIEVFYSVKRKQNDAFKDWNIFVRQITPHTYVALNLKGQTSRNEITIIFQACIIKILRSIE